MLTQSVYLKEQERTLTVQTADGDFWLIEVDFICTSYFIVPLKLG